MTEKKIRIAAIADIHGSNKLPYAKPSEHGRTDRFDQQLALLKRFEQSARDFNADAIFVLGDIYDKSLIDAVTLTHVMDSIAGWSIDTYLLPGNHDASSVRGGRYSVEAFGVINNKHLHVLDGVEPFELAPWLCFWPVRYMPVAATNVSVAEARKLLDKKKTNVLLFHNSVLGAHHEGWTCDEGLEVEHVVGRGFDWTFAGHFHETQKFGEGGRGLYLGAPMHHHFGDVGRRAGYWLLEFSRDGECKRKFVDGGAPRFHVMKGLDAIVKTVKTDEAPKSGDYVRVEVEMTYAEWSKYKMKARELCDALSAKGINASYQFRPVYHHKVRMASESKKATVSLEESISQYVDMATVDHGDLNVRELKRVGAEALMAVRVEYGAV
jgi:DNA repair exonuclease SbcCD nuclease subunit